MSHAYPASSASASGSVRIALGCALAGAAVWFDAFILVLIAPQLAVRVFGQDAWASLWVVPLVFLLGMVLRPVGAAVFGRLADRRGPEQMLRLILPAMALVAVLMSGLSGLGVAVLVVLRLAQGLLAGAVPGPALALATRAAPENRRGLSAAAVQAGTILGLLAATGVVMALCACAGAAAFDDWGWKVAPALSAFASIAAFILLGLRSGDPIAEAPPTEAGAGAGKKTVWLTFMSLALGQAVVFYIGLVGPLIYLRQSVRLDPPTAEAAVVLAAGAALVLTLAFGWLSDRVGRKWIAVSGCILAAVTLYPLHTAVLWSANPARAQVSAGDRIMAFVQPQECAGLYNFAAQARSQTSCDIVRTALEARGVPFMHSQQIAGQPSAIGVGPDLVDGFDGAGLDKAAFDQTLEAFDAGLDAKLARVGYGDPADPDQVNFLALAALLIAMALPAAMVLGAGGAMMCELLAGQRRASAMGLTLQIAVGWVAGLLPAAAFVLTLQLGISNIWLLVPTFLAGLAAIVGAVNLPETRKTGAQT